VAGRLRSDGDRCRFELRAGPDAPAGPGEDRGFTAFDGIGLLVHQAALSLSLWLGRDVPSDLLQGALSSGME
jgi:hypothetical protein